MMSSVQVKFKYNNMTALRCKISVTNSMDHPTQKQRKSHSEFSQININLHLTKKSSYISYPGGKHFYKMINHLPQHYTVCKIKLLPLLMTAEQLPHLLDNLLSQGKNKRSLQFWYKDLGLHLTYHQFRSLVCMVLLLKMHYLLKKAL